MNLDELQRAVPLEDVIAVIERELPGWRWAVGRCTCGLTEGDYIAQAETEDFMPITLITFDPQTNEMNSHPPTGHHVHCHGASPALALSKVLELAHEARGTKGPEG